MAVPSAAPAMPPTAAPTGPPTIAPVTAPPAAPLMVPSWAMALVAKEAAMIAQDVRMIFFIGFSISLPFGLKNLGEEVWFRFCGHPWLTIVIRREAKEADRSV